MHNSNSDLENRLICKFRDVALRVLPVLVMVAIFFLPDAADACPNCKDGLHQNYLAVAFGFSVLFMMAMPFSILAAWMFFIYQANRVNPDEVGQAALIDAEPG